MMGKGRTPAPMWTCSHPARGCLLLANAYNLEIGQLPDRIAGITAAMIQFLPSHEDQLDSMYERFVIDQRSARHA